MSVKMQDNDRLDRAGHGHHSVPRAVAFLLLATAALAAYAQTPVNAAAPPPDKPPVITLAEAIHRAEASDPAYAAASAQSRSASLDRSIARASLLPSVSYYSQGIYTQPNGIYTEGDEGEPSAPLPRFVANDSRPREYLAQGIVDETLSLAGPAAVKRANAAAAQAEAEQEIARRGLVAGVTVLFYRSLAADHKLTVAQRALREASDFTKLTREREQARESAHADVVKAELVEQQRGRDLEDAKVAAERARLELGVLLFPDPETPYTLSAPADAPPLAPRADVDAAAAKNDPELKSALATLKVSDADVMAARAAYLPSVGLNVTYGIDANEFAVNGPLTPDGVQARNLGYSASLTLKVPVWDWLATQHKVKQSEIRRGVAQVALSATQRRLIAQLDEAYSDAHAAHDELASLDQSVATAAESLRLTKLRYSGGDATVLEVVDAENSLVTVEDAREDGRVRYQAALANLQTLTGTM
jgi:outer membrane protein TolC